MQYMDPLTVECTFCKKKAAYPLKDLESYQAICIHCNKSLAYASRKISQKKSEHATDSWISWFKLEIIEEYNLLDSISDEEFENANTLGEFVNLLNRHQSTITFDTFANHPKLTCARQLFALETLINISLDDIALVSITSTTFPFNEFALIGARIFTGDHFLDNHSVIIHKDRIENIIPTTEVSADIFKIDLNGGVLAPGFIDLQVNGGGGKFFTNTPNLSAINNILDAHRSKGTTSLLPTLISEGVAPHQAGVTAVKTAIAAGFKGVLGIHIEGPFFSAEKRGAHAEKFIREITKADIDWLKTINTHDLKFLLTLAPETIPQGIIHQLSQSGILVFAGHTNATYEQTLTALGEGLHGFTHLYNAMRPTTARDPGVVGAALENNHSWCGIILDGHHVHPAVARAACRLKKDKLFLVSDAMATVGSKDKSFLLYDENIAEIAGASPKLVTQQGKLAGSAIGLIDAVRYATVDVGLELAKSLRMASLYPACCLQLDHQLGKIQPGYRADLVHFTENFGVTSTWVAGDWQVHC